MLALEDRIGSWRQSDFRAQLPHRIAPGPRDKFGEPVDDAGEPQRIKLLQPWRWSQHAWIVVGEKRDGRENARNGFVAKFWEEATQASTCRLIVNPELGRESEQLADKARLADCISFGQPSHSALPDHVHCLDTLQRPPRTLKGSIALGQPNSFLNRPVVLFNHVIEILALA